MLFFGKITIKNPKTYSKLSKRPKIELVVKIVTAFIRKHKEIFVNEFIFVKFESLYR